MASKKLQITLDDRLISRLDDFCDRNYSNRSGIIGVALMQYLNAQQISDCIKDLSITMRRIADNGVISDDDKVVLSDLEALASFLGGKS